MTNYTYDSGAITDTYQYDAYGEITSKTGTTDNNYLYTGEQYDRSLNQYYLRARYYNQGVGRFTQMDTWQGQPYYPSSLNKYLYAEANPTMYTDPSGKFISLGGLMSGLRVGALMSNMTIASAYSYGKLSGDKGWECWTKCVEKKTVNNLVMLAGLVGELTASTHKRHLGYRPIGSPFTSVLSKLSVVTKRTFGTNFGLRKISRWIKSNPMNAKIAKALGKGGKYPSRFPATQASINAVYYAGSAYVFYSGVSCAFRPKS